MSELTSYKKSALQLALEWEDHLTKEEWKTLYIHLQSLSLEEWEAWKKKHLDLIDDLVVFSHNKALKTLSSLSSLDRLLYIFAVSQRCIEAYLFLEKADRCSLYAQQAISSREMTQIAAYTSSDYIVDTAYSPIWNWSYPAPYKDMNGEILIETFVLGTDRKTPVATKFHKLFPAEDLMDV